MKKAGKKVNLYVVFAWGNEGLCDSWLVKTTKDHLDLDPTVEKVTTPDEQLQYEIIAIEPGLAIDLDKKNKKG